MRTDFLTAIHWVAVRLASGRGDSEHTSDSSLSLSEIGIDSGLRSKGSAALSASGGGGLSGSNLAVGSSLLHQRNNSAQAANLNSSLAAVMQSNHAAASGAGGLGQKAIGSRHSLGVLRRTNSAVNLRMVSLHGSSSSGDLTDMSRQQAPTVRGRTGSEHLSRSGSGLSLNLARVGSVSSLRSGGGSSDSLQLVSPSNMASSMFGSPGTSLGGVNAGAGHSVFSSPGGDRDRFGRDRGRLSPRSARDKSSWLCVVTASADGILSIYRADRGEEPLQSLPSVALAVSPRGTLAFVNNRFDVNDVGGAFRKREIIASSAAAGHCAGVVEGGTASPFAVPPPALTSQRTAMPLEEAGGGSAAVVLPTAARRRSGGIGAALAQARSRPAGALSPPMLVSGGRLATLIDRSREISTNSTQEIFTSEHPDSAGSSAVSSFGSLGIASPWTATAVAPRLSNGLSSALRGALGGKRPAASDVAPGGGENTRPVSPGQSEAELTARIGPTADLLAHSFSDHGVGGGGGSAGAAEGSLSASKTASVPHSSAAAHRRAAAAEERALVQRTVRTLRFSDFHRYRTPAVRRTVTTNRRYPAAQRRSRKRHANTKSVKERARHDSGLGSDVRAVKFLAEHYRFRGDTVVALCEHNAGVSLRCKRPLLAHMWSTVALLHTPMSLPSASVSDYRATTASTVSSSQPGSAGAVSTIASLAIVDDAKSALTPMKRNTVRRGVETSLEARGGGSTNREGGLVQTNLLMCAAAAAGNVERLAELIAGGAIPSQGDYDHRTPLHLAASDGRLDALLFLLEAGADPSAVDRWGGVTQLSIALCHCMTPLRAYYVPYIHFEFIMMIMHYDFFNVHSCRDATLGCAET